MTEEERFQYVKNIYMNYEHELSQRGMEDVAPLAANLTNSYLMREMIDSLNLLITAIKS